ncbi:MAG: hypothetical protein LBV69_05280 [Bacteroidales bacterium]|jgi:hypothetical protein|nr:hypothetical protein [Bacteroidales bacterium]
MKKFMFILVAILTIVGIAILFSSFATKDDGKSDSPCSDCTCSCGGELYYSTQAYQYEKQCYACGGYGYLNTSEWVSCNSCEGTGKQKCKNCGNGTTYYDYWNCCPNCKSCGGNKGRNEMGHWQTKNGKCRSCGGDGIELVWQSGCKCRKCGQGYTGCNN